MSAWERRWLISKHASSTPAYMLKHTVWSCVSKCIVRALWSVGPLLQGQSCGRFSFLRICNVCLPSPDQPHLDARFCLLIDFSHRLVRSSYPSCFTPSPPAAHSSVSEVFAHRLLDICWLWLTNTAIWVIRTCLSSSRTGLGTSVPLTPVTAGEFGPIRKLNLWVAESTGMKTCKRDIWIRIRQNETRDTVCSVTGP